MLFLLTAILIKIVYIHCILECFSKHNIPTSQEITEEKYEKERKSNHWSQERKSSLEALNGKINCTINNYLDCMLGTLWLL